jgi:hypothetical protein
MKINFFHHGIFSLSLSSGTEEVYRAPMSELGHLQTLAKPEGMSALHPKADITCL